MRPQICMHIVKNCSELEEIAEMFADNWIFRGMPNFDYSLLSIAERDFPCLEMLLAIEIITKKRIKSHYELTGKGEANIHNMVSEYSEFQHFFEDGTKTRFLDFTNDFWIALWFALVHSCPKFEDQDAIVWAINTKKIPWTDAIIDGRDPRRNNFQIALCGYEHFLSDRPRRQGSVLLVPRNFIFESEIFNKGAKLKSMEHYIADQLGVNFDDIFKERKDMQFTEIENAVALKLKLPQYEKFRKSAISYLRKNHGHLDKEYLFPPSNSRSKSRDDESDYKEEGISIYENLVQRRNNRTLKVKQGRLKEEISKFKNKHDMVHSIFGKDALWHYIRGG